jgi:uncharacterized membrane protein
MENTNTPHDSNEQKINQQFSQQFSQMPFTTPLPSGTGALVLGIVSTVFSVIWCYWIGSLIGLACGIIALIMSNNGKKLVAEFPNKYSLPSIGNNNAGRILGIIGICIASLGLLGLIIVLIIVGSIGGFMNDSMFH